MRMTTLFAILILSAMLAVAASAQKGALHPTRLRCEYAVDPIGLGEKSPRLFWIVESSERGQVQSAYRILAASSKEALASGQGNLWDSGVVKSDETTHIEYKGKPLYSRKGVWWKVRVWDRSGIPSDWSQPAYFELGLLENSDWKARWIGLPGGDSAEVSLEGAKWIWYPELDEKKSAPTGTRLLRLDFNLPAGKKASSASLAIAADNAHTAYVNGKEVGSGSSFQSVVPVDVTQSIKPGSNILAIAGTNHGGPAGVVAALQIQYPDGTQLRFFSDKAWKTAQDAPAEWKSGPGASKDWKNAIEVAILGEAPWGKPRFGLPAGPSPFARKEIGVAKAVRRARIYASALGLYQLYLDGKKVGDAYFTPGWTDYRKRVQSQTYDVTSRLGKGRHALGIVLGDGWYCGNVCWFGRNQYGPKPMGLVQLEIEYSDGSKQVVASDRSWRVSAGPILLNDILMGESYDAGKELKGWAETGFDDSSWVAAATKQIGSVPVVAQNTARVTKVAELKPKAQWKDSKGNTVYDLGQNMVGWARLKVRGRAGDKVTLRFAEVLNPDKTIYTTNLRKATQTDTYILKGGAEEVWEPHFTFHGFRYVELSGIPAPPADAITGVVLSSANEPTGSFECSNTMVNKLQRNIVWGMMGNYLEVPTDCPQRDERLGWMGDAQVFIRTGCFSFNIAPFMMKWIQDVRDSQSAEGAYRDVTPGVLGENNSGAPAWGDAGVIVPWTVYLCYGDKRVLERHYESMKRWIAYIQAENSDLIWIKRTGNNYGDWLSINADTPKEVLSTAYFAYSTRLVAKTAEVLGKTEDAAKYEELFGRIREVFNRQFVYADGTIKGETQTCYVLALWFDLLPEDKRQLAAQHLAQDIMFPRDMHLSTGFVGTGYLNPCLTSINRPDLAYRLLVCDTFPSWGYTIANGATTIWERWDGWTDTKGFQDPGMNSFNHYAFGAIGEWMYSTVAGIDLDPGAPAYKKVVIHPIPSGELLYAKAALDSVHGRIESSWKVEKLRFTLDVTIPANVEATVVLPTDNAKEITEGKVKAMEAKGVKFVKTEGLTSTFKVGGGKYRFSCMIPTIPTEASAATHPAKARR